MSDALTDIARDEKRGRAFERYLETILSFLRGVADSAVVVAAAISCDSVPRGYWGSATSLAGTVNPMLDGLRNNDAETWARLLDSAMGDGSYQPKVYVEFCKLSPWPEKKMCRVSFGRFDRGLNEILEPYLKQAGKAARFRGNPSGYFEYVVFYDEDATLLDMAKSAVCVGVQATSWTPSVAQIVPVSSSLEYLQERQRHF